VGERFKEGQFMLLITLSLSFPVRKTCQALIDSRKDHMRWGSEDLM